MHGPSATQTLLSGDADQIARLERELAEALEYQTAINDVLAVISHSPSDLRPVLDTIAEIAERLCGADRAQIFTERDGMFHLAAHRNTSQEFLDYLALHPFEPGMPNTTGRAVLESRTIHAPDVLADPTYDLSRLMGSPGGARLSVPLLHDDRAIGVITVSRAEPRAFTDRQIGLVTTFASQAVIAINNARLFEAEQTRTRELAESLEYQTATSDVLSVISKSPGTLEPVFQAMLDNAVRVCGASFGNLLLYDGEKFRHVALHNAPRGWVAEQERDPVPPRNLARVLYRVPVTKRLVHIADLMTVNPDEPIATLAGARTLLIVPMLKQDELVGVIAVYRQEVRPFTEKQIELVDGFAKHAVIAIENARLLDELQTRQRELTESLEYQTAMAEVLGVISRSPSDSQPVFEVIARMAWRLCEAEGSTFLVTELDGRLRMVAMQDPVAEQDFRDQLENKPFAPDRGSTSGRAMLEGRTVHIHDVQADPEFDFLKSDAHLDRRHTMLGVPVLRAGNVIGVITLVRTEVKPFTARQIALVETFADQAVIAIENARLLDELQTRERELTESLDQQTATADVLKIISKSPSDLQPVLDAIVATAARLCEARWALVWKPQDGKLALAAHNAAPKELVAYVKAHPMDFDRGSVVGRAALDGLPVHIADVLADPLFTQSGSQRVSGLRTCLGVPLRQDGRLLGVMSLARDHVRPFSQPQIDLVATFAEQAVIAMNNAQLFEEVQARTREVIEALEYQTATADVLSVISKSPNELQPVLDSIMDTALRLCRAERGSILRLDGDGFRPVAFAGNAIPSAFKQRFLSEPAPADRSSITGRVALDKQPVHIIDARAEPGLSYLRGEVDDRRTMLGVPLLRHGAVVGVIMLVRTEVQPFTDKQIDLVATFADQAVIAINNVGLFEQVQARTRELTESLEYQTAISEVLGVISRSPNELQPVLDVIAGIAARLCGADWALIRKLAADGEYHAVAFSGAQDQFVEFVKAYAIRPSRDLVAGRALLERKAIHIADVTAEADFLGRQEEVRQVGKFRSVLAVPLLRYGEPIGVIVLLRTVVRPFEDRQIRLIETFADQAVIAINNVGLFEAVQARTKELAESLEYQTATSEVLSVISRSPNELQPVLDAIVETAGRLCEADYAHCRLEKDGRYHVMARHSPRPEVIERMAGIPIAADRTSVTGRAVLERRTIHLPDISLDPEETYTERVGSPSRTSLGVPLLRGGEVTGVIGLFRLQVRPFTERQIELVTTFADQAVIAINNVGLFEEVQARSKELARSVEELQALGEVGRTVSSTLDMPKVLQTVLVNACKMAFAGGGTIYVYDKATASFRLEAGYNMSEEHISRVRQQPIRMGDAVVGEAAERREAVQIADLLEADRARSPLLDILVRAGIRAILAVPLLHQGEVLGALVVRRNHPGAFTPETVRLLETFAAQSAIAVHNARLFEEIKEKGHQLQLASQHKSQFLANMSHELRTPLNAILGYTELMQDGIYGALPEKAGGVLGRVQTNGQHLLGLINSVLDLSKIEAGQLQLDIVEYGMPAVVEAVVVATESLAIEKKLKLEANVPDNLPRGLGDERRITQVLLNLVGNAIKFTEQGAVTIDAALVGDRFLVSVADTGPGIPPAELERVFEEFHQVDSSNTKAKGGTGLGLAIAKRIIEMHGGRIWVESTPGQGATFRFELPVSVKQSEGDDDQAHTRH